MRLPATVGALAAAACAALPAQAQIFHLYLHCQGVVVASAPAPSAPAAARGADAPMAQKLDDGPAGATTVASSDKNDAGSDENSKPRSAAAKAAFARSAKSGGANLELALRDNNMTAFVQRSNVLPTGERMKYTATQTHYAATFTPAAGRASAEYRGSWLFSWHPPFQKMAAARFSIDRQTGQLEGEMVGPGGDVLGLIDMQCEPKKDGEGPAPRF